MTKEINSQMLHLKYLQILYQKQKAWGETYTLMQILFWHPNANPLYSITPQTNKHNGKL